MNILIASIYFEEVQQAYPIFVDHIKKLNPAPKKIVLFDLFDQRKLDQSLVQGLIEIRAQQREKNLMQQVTKIRNQTISEAKEKNFEAVLFLQPNIFPPTDILQRLYESNHDVIAPAFFSNHNGVIFSNALKKARQGKDLKSSLDMMAFNDLIPSGIKEVFGVSLEAIFLNKSVFGSVEFSDINTALEEMISFKEQLEKAGKKIYLDSATVCAKLSPLQLMSYYYFKAQKVQQNQIQANL